jgi:hypothetical protein
MQSSIHRSRLHRSRRGFFAVMLGFTLAGPLAQQGGGQITTLYACQSNALYEAPAPLANEHLGGSICLNGDFNGDQVPDVIIGGDAKPSGGADNTTRALLFLGTASSPSLTLVGNGLRDLFGYRVAFLKDVNGDGRDEVLVTAPNFPTETQRIGRAYIFLGRSISAPLTLSAESCADIILIGETPGARFGDSVAVSRSWTRMTPPTSSSGPPDRSSRMAPTTLEGSSCSSATEIWGRLWRTRPSIPAARRAIRQSCAHPTSTTS